MAKGNPFGHVPGMGDMMKKVQKMAADTQRVEQELGETTVEATSGGGMVKAIANGKGEILDITIDAQVVDPEDVEMLQDLVVSAVREAIEKGNALRQARLGELTGGISIPGLF